MTDCTHQIETLRHGVVTLALAEFEATDREEIIGGGSIGTALGNLHSFLRHEAKETELEDETRSLIASVKQGIPLLKSSFAEIEDEFVKRAVAALVQCECQKGNPG